MSQKLNELRHKLEKWESHIEASATASDYALYEFLDEFLNLIDGYEQTPEVIPVPAEASNTASAENEGPGGNNPGAPTIP